MSRRSETNGSTFSIIGEGVEINGNIDATIDLHIDGNIIGDIKCTALTQGPSSYIKGVVVAQKANLSGTVEGSINADDLTITSSAKITGDVCYEDIAIEQGGCINGKLNNKDPQMLNSNASTNGVGSAVSPLENSPPPLDHAAPLSDPDEFEGASSINPLTPAS